MTHIVIDMKCSVEELQSRLEIAEGNTTNGSQGIAQEAAQKDKEKGSLREGFRTG